MDQVLLFGYVVLFAVAFPLGPLLGYLSNTIQMKFFGTALLNYYQRNMPYGVTNIGAFQTCFETVARFSIVTNSAVVVWTMSHSVLGLWDYATRIWIFGALVFS